MLLFYYGLAKAQVLCEDKYSAYINGIWGKKKKKYTDYYYGRFSEVYHIGDNRHPCEYSWKWTLHDFV